MSENQCLRGRAKSLECGIPVLLAKIFFQKKVEILANCVGRFGGEGRQGLSEERWIFGIHLEPFLHMGQGEAEERSICWKKSTIRRLRVVLSRLTKAA